jgi:hypothetical protein
MMGGGRQRSLARMVDPVWCQAIIFRTANNSEKNGNLDGHTCVFINTCSGCYFAYMGGQHEILFRVLI